MIDGFCRWSRSLFAWRIVLDDDVWTYSENVLTGRRKALWNGGGYGPIRYDLLDDGDIIYGPGGRREVIGPKRPVKWTHPRPSDPR